jgi:hypothetical protein
MSELKTNNDTVKVAVRVRPINKSEQSENASSIISVSDNVVNITESTSSTSKSFGFDYAFGTKTTNSDIYNSIGRDIVKNAVAGYNCCILAYGQTGSGKTYTMLNYTTGEKNGKISENDSLKNGKISENDSLKNGKISNNGLIPKIAEELLLMSSLKTSPNIEYQIEVSFVEIYAEKIFDLLADNNNHNALKLHINPKIGTYIENLTSIAVTNINQVMKLIEKGFKHRSTSSTAMNEQSSRSHAIFNISFKQITYFPFIDEDQKSRKIISEKTSKIKLVDLAGSERVKTSKVIGINFQEAIAINKSLSMLSTVFNELVETGTTTKCRSSTLTALLADSIGGNSKTVIIANVSPASIQYEISLQTLFYVHRTKKIVVKAHVNEITSPETQSIVNELKAEIERLKSELFKTTDLEEVNRLKEELTEYERLYKESTLSWSDKLKSSQESITILETELTRRNSIIVEKENEKISLMNEKLKLETEIANKHKELENLIRIFDVEKANLSEEKARLIVEKANLSEEKARLIVEKANLSEEKESLANEIYNMQNEKTILMGDKVSLTNEKLSLLSDKVSLMDNIHNLATEAEHLHAVIDEMNHNVEILKIENNHLVESLDNLKAERQKHADRLKNLNDRFKPKQ